MNYDSFSDASDLPLYGKDNDDFYTLDVFAELAGVETRTVLLYQQKGFIQPVRRDRGNSWVFDTECLLKVRRIEHLRAACEMNDTGLDLLLSLLREVEQLRQERRKRLR